MEAICGTSEIGAIPVTALDPSYADTGEFTMPYLPNAIVTRPQQLIRGQ